jgi:hypothetical protein
MLSSRYKRTGNIKDRETALNYFVKSSECSHAIPLERVKAARFAIRILQDCNGWERASLLAQAAVKILPHVCGRYLSREDQQHTVLQTSGLAADACSLSLKTGRVDQATFLYPVFTGIFRFVVDHILHKFIEIRDDLTSHVIKFTKCGHW